ncbi:MAG: acyl-CoA transferase, partial [Porticoccaceae bacterium]
MKMIFILLLWPVLAQAMPTEPVAPINTQYDATNGLIARLDFEQADQIVEALLRVEAYYEQQGFTESHTPVTFVIFGPPVAIFFKTNYSDNKQIVDLAARLTALQVIDVRVCEFSYQAEGLD